MVNEKEIKDWYNMWHSSKGENAWRQNEAYPIFLDHLNVNAGKKLLDIGCGTGYLLKEASRRGLYTHGIDISEKAVEISQRISPKSKITMGHGENLNLPDNYFDYVTCLGALEHFLDIEKGLEEMVRVGKSDSLFCIVVPNINFLFWKIGISKGTKQQDVNETLLSLNQWKNLFNKKGLKTLKIHSDKEFISNIRVSSSTKLLEAMKLMIYKSVVIILPLNYTYQLVFLLKKI